MNTYEKLTVASFTTRLENGQYESVAGARRAIGKAHSLTDADKEKAKKLIDKFFEGNAGAKKERANSPTSDAPKRRGRPPAAAAAPTPKVAKVARKKAGRPAKARSAGKSAVKMPFDNTLKTTGPDLSRTPVTLSEMGPADVVALSLNAVDIVGRAVGVMREARELFPEVDNREVQSAVNALTPVLQLLRESFKAAPAAAVELAKLAVGGGRVGEVAPVPVSTPNTAPTTKGTRVMSPEDPPVAEEDLSPLEKSQLATLRATKPSHLEAPKLHVPTS